MNWLKGWRSLLLGGLVVICIGSVVTIAQNLTKSIQLSQDPSGPIGMDTSNNVYFPAHILNVGSAPTLAGGGGTGGTVTGSDFAGTIQEGTGTVSHDAITFRLAFGAAPVCLITAATAMGGGTASPSPPSWTTSTGGFVVQHSPSSTTMKLTYICSGAQ